MKKIGLLLLLTFACSALQAQTMLSYAQVLGKIYNHYDDTTQTAELTCVTQAELRERTCSNGVAAEEVEVLLLSEAGNKLYVVTSATPVDHWNGSNCHACAPELGVAIFAWHENRWEIESINTKVGKYGSWGRPPGANLISLGPEYGVLLSLDDESGGESYSSTVLLAPIGKTVDEVWRIHDEQDDYGDYDPKGVDGSSIRYRFSSAIRFDCIFTDSCSNGNGYFDIEVISRGNDYDFEKKQYISKNFTDVYSFKDGKYVRVRHKVFRELPAKVTGK